MTKSNQILASKYQRIFNVIVDMIVFFFIWLILTIILFAIGLDYTIIDEKGEETPIVPLIILVPTFWGYYFLAEYKFQKTVGKFLTKTIVVSISGDKPTTKQLVIRTLCRSIPFEYFSFLTSDSGIHDSLSKTIVIKN